MTVPNFRDKHGEPALVTPEDSKEYHGDGNEGHWPEAVVLCYHDGLFERIAETRSARSLDMGLCEFRVLEGVDADVGVAGEFGIGAPVAALLMEELIVRGVRRFLSVGHVGALDTDVPFGSVIVPTRAIRDEGTSHHYLEPDTYVDVSPSLLADIEASLEDAGVDYHAGPNWTTDAPFRETAAEVERYREAGVLTVDMELSATLAVAEYRNVEAGGLFTVSDYLGDGEWEPRFRETLDHLEGVFDLGVAALGG